MRTAIAAIAALLLGVFAHAAYATACDGFVDVDAASATYCPAVTYLKDHGITVGCTDSTHYCPNDYVTRQQMALFLQRMSKVDATNTVTADGANVAGGAHNTASGLESIVGGGNSNVASGFSSSVTGGGANTASNIFSTVLGGYADTASGQYSTVLGGYSDTASGQYSTVLGGAENIAASSYSVAVGSSANADLDHCMVIALWDSGSPMNCIGSNSVVRVGDMHGFWVDYHSQSASGTGTRWAGIGDLFTNQTIATWTGAYLSDAGVWTNVSDRNAKQGFTPLDAADILDRVVHMPVERWSYKAEPQATHIGPVAQDFYAAFSVGTDDKHITPIDEGGVALAAIQALAAQNAAQAQRLATLEAQLVVLMAEHTKQ